MQKKSTWGLALLIIFGLMLTPPGSALATIINFDSLAAFGTIEGVNLGGVTITTLDEGYFFGGIAMVVPGDSFGGVGYRSAYNVVSNFGPDREFIVDYPMQFVFDSEVNFVSFTGGDAGGDIDHFKVRLFDSSDGNLLDFTTPLFGGNTLDPAVMVDFYTFTSSLTGIKRMVVSNSSGIVIDDLEFRAPVPEPATMLLLGAGLIGLAGYSRKKFKSN